MDKRIRPDGKDGRLGKGVNEMGIFWDNAIKITRGDEWNATNISDVMLIQAISVEAGLPPILGELEVAAVIEKLEKTEAIPARHIVEFVLRCLDYGWLDFKEPYGYKSEMPEREQK